MNILFVGTGVSTAIPVMGHLRETCACQDAMYNPNSRNRRNNVSILVRPTITPPLPDEIAAVVSDDFVSAGYNAPLTVQRKRLLATYRPAVLVDCGKTFRTAYFTTLAPRGIEVVSSVLLTHDHADAMMGLDDLRDLQALAFTESSGEVRCEYYLPCYASAKTIRTLRQQCAYIYNASANCGFAPPTVKDAEALRVLTHSGQFPTQERRVTCLDMFSISDEEPQRIGVVGLTDDYRVYTVPVEHGAGYISLGYVFIAPATAAAPPEGDGGNGSVDGAASTPPPAAAASQKEKKGKCVVYLSDISFMPEESLAFLLQLGHVDLLIIDMLLGEGCKHNTHYCVDDVMRLTHKLQPRRVLGVGMWCTLEHDAANKRLGELLAEHHSKGLSLGVESIELAYDGLEVSIE